MGGLQGPELDSPKFCVKGQTHPSSLVCSNYPGVFMVSLTAFNMHVKVSFWPFH